MKRISLADLAQDAAALAGACLVTAGAGEAWRPAGFITAGLFLLTGAWLAARKSS